MSIAHEYRSLKQTLFWAFTMTWGTQGIGNAVSLVLAVILGPKDFGIVAIASVYLSLLQIILAQGMEDALVQRKDVENSHFDSVFWFLAASGVVLMGLGMAGSGWWARMNQHHLVGTVILVLSLKIPLYSLIIVPRAVRVRQLGFKGLALQVNCSEAAAGAVGIGMAIGGAGLWSLVGQNLGRDVIFLVLLWVFSDWRPKLRFSWQHVKALLPFSGPCFAADVGAFMRGQVDTMLIGLFFGPIAVGLYRLADRIRESLLMLLTRSLQWVSLPSLSKLQDDPIGMKETYLKLLKVSLTGTVPIMIALASASGLVVAALGPKWYAASAALSILCLVGSIESFTVLTVPLLQARSKPAAVATLVWVFGVVSAAMTAGCGLLLKDYSISWQVNGMALCKLSVIVLAFLPVNIAMVKSVAGVSGQELFGATFGGATAAAASLLIIWLIKTYVLPAGLAPALALSLALAPAALVAVALILWREREWRAHLSRLFWRRLLLRTS